LGCISTPATNQSTRNARSKPSRTSSGGIFDLDTSGSAFYLAAWQDGDAAGIQERLGRISSTAQKIIGTVAEG